MNGRVCGYRGASLEGFRKQVRFCSAAHRRETLRISRLVQGFLTAATSRWLRGFKPSVRRVENVHKKPHDNALPHLRYQVWWRGAD